MPCPALPHTRAAGEGLAYPDGGVLQYVLGQCADLPHLIRMTDSGMPPQNLQARAPGSAAVEKLGYRHARAPAVLLPPPRGLAANAPCGLVVVAPRIHHPLHSRRPLDLPPAWNVRVVGRFCRFFFFQTVKYTLLPAHSQMLMMIKDKDPQLLHSLNMSPQVGARGFAILRWSKKALCRLLGACARACL